MRPLLRQNNEEQLERTSIPQEGFETAISFVLLVKNREVTVVCYFETNTNFKQWQLSSQAEKANIHDLRLHFIKVSYKHIDIRQHLIL
jgi:heme-degrading monooxygenase HmoA